ncbi:MAG: hypothetical protein E6Q40_11190 [Cupriavidus sp.]|nr:MAG: hypothetical protein E6Q40_11190 [Cupriavidus sp.]
MKLSLLLPVAAAIALPTLRLEAAERTPVIVTNPDAPAATEDKPAFLYFKEGIITRKGKNKIEFDLTMADSIPAGTDRNRELVFWVKFDLDNTTKTGKAPITFPSFGQDIFCCIYKPRGTSQWKTYSDTSNITGRSETLEISKVRVSGDKVGFELSSPLLGEFPVSRCLLLSGTSQFEKGAETSGNTTDQLPRGGAFTINGD